MLKYQQMQRLNFLMIIRHLPLMGNWNFALSWVEPVENFTPLPPLGLIMSGKKTEFQNIQTLEIKMQ